MALDALESLLGERFTRSSAVRLAHGRGEAFHADMPPDAVVFPRSTAEVQAVVRLCAMQRVPLIAFGAGSSLEGNVAAVAGGVTLDLTAMDAILAVNDADMDCAVQPGVTREALNAHLRDAGLFFPIDPGANATIGGMVATRASGTNAVRYGTMRDNVLWLTVVTADGSVVRTARRARKSSAGYDLTRLFVGSEGTLGIVTEIGLRLHGQPEKIAAASVAFDSLDGAVRSVVEILQIGVPVARVEILDAAMVGAVNAYSKTGFAERPSLLFEFHGSEAGVREQAETVAMLTEANGGWGFEWALRTEDRNRLWAARHHAYHAAQGLRPGSRLIVTDVCVPIARLTECLVETHADIAAAGIVAPIVGHVGDGNFHVFLTVDPDNEAEIAQARELNDRLVARALAMDGTCTGEHGIGLGKQDKLVDELGSEAVALMRRIKQALDPHNILNPGKIFRFDQETSQ
ncbi:FAD-binding oxidoreductase [Sandaracinobacteroides saxicola]|uniref:FAD-binding oxidoreductase n=1 Tax=Sandaracinobacteroides saxicola TaxID=2759707 RepID=UPI001FB13BD3|nr:FAD-linked oxidase C-terminal domain-containing protein [Sandaracinobacteroides saxicola]